MRTSTNQFNVNDAAAALPTTAEFLQASFDAHLAENPQDTPKS